jgi:hypothetical protein
MTKKIIGAISIISVLLRLLSGTALAATPPVVRISEIKIGGVVTGQPTEFVEIHNDSNDVIDLSGWNIEYAKAASTLTPQTCNELDWQAIAGTTNIKVTNLSGFIQPRGSYVATLLINDDQAGSLRLSQTANSVKTVYDLVGWYGKTINNVTQQPVCYKSSPAPFPNNQTKLSIKRSYDADGFMKDTNNNGLDFTLSDQPSPTTDICSVNSQCTNTQTVVTVPQTQPECSGVQLNELLPNPSGSDTTGEYIELYNPTIQTINLDGCFLKLGANGKQYSFLATDTLAPHEYKSYGYSTTGLQLVNTGGEVWLVSSIEETIVTYPVSSDDQAWAYVDGVWNTTYEPTPNAANVLYIPAPAVMVSPTTSLESCPEGKYRNPDTNRCKSIDSSDNGLAPCADGQERNAETNRCRSLNLAETSPVPCKEGYERNTETNRCRKMEVIDSTLKVCDLGEERNPETNRCRKVGGVAGVASTAGSAKDALNKSSQNYRILLIILVITGAYGVYEYRHDFANAFVRIRERHTKKNR